MRVKRKERGGARGLFLMGFQVKKVEVLSTDESHCVVFMDKTLKCHSAHPLSGV